MTKFLDEAIAIWNWTAEYVVYLLHDGAGGGVDNKETAKGSETQGSLKYPFWGESNLMQIYGYFLRDFHGFSPIKVPCLGW